MANLLKMAVRETIRTLHAQNWSQRRIASELGINRETVARYLREAGGPSKPANAPIGSREELSEAKPANAPIGSEASVVDDADVTTASPGSSPDRTRFGKGRGSFCEPWREPIRTKCDLGFSAQRIY